MSSALSTNSRKPAPTRSACLAAVAILALTSASQRLPAAETDQFLAWGVELADSSPELNRYVNRQFEEELAELGRRRSEGPCEAVPGRLYLRVFKTLLNAPVRDYLRTDDEIDRFPGSDVGFWEFRDETIFRKVTWPFFLPMSRTVRIGDVYMGVDKISHFFGFGRRYHSRYQRALRRGLTPEEAQRKVVLWGLRAERFFVGGVTDGIISHADLEANYQGFRMALDMCRGDDPYLERTADGWRLRRPVDVAEYVNPAFDESYNTNHYHPYRWHLVQPILVEEVCPLLDSEPVRRRLARYRELDPGSFSRQVISERYGRNENPLPVRHSLQAACGIPLPVANDRLAASW